MPTVLKFGFMGKYYYAAKKMSGGTLNFLTLNPSITSFERKSAFGVKAALAFPWQAGPTWNLDWRLEFKPWIATWQTPGSGSYRAASECNHPSHN
jgi:hypothetical protein